MKSRIIRIGNSQGIRIPKTMLEQTGLNGEVDLEIRDDALIVSPSAQKPRAGWAAAFKEMARREDDALLDEGGFLPTQWEEEEWQW